MTQSPAGSETCLLAYRRVAVIGGGLAGLAATCRLAEQGCQVQLFETRRSLGGRAGSFADRATGELVDHCQHVSMGCCTNLADFARRIGIDTNFTRHRTLHFFGPNGRRCDFRGSRWLPAPLHLGPALWSLKYLSLRDRLGVAICMLRLARLTPRCCEGRTIGDWLREQQASAAVCERFWSVVLVSALSETLDRIALAHARQVFVDGFMRHRDSYVMEIPAVPLGELYGKQLETALTQLGATLSLETRVKQVLGEAERVTAIELADGSRREFDAVVVAVPWQRVRELFTPELAARLDWLDNLDHLHGVPISGLHLWFDRPLTELPHAVLVDRLAQWVFRRESSQPTDSDSAGHYYQVVISASRALAGRDRDEVIAEVTDELRALWPAASGAKLLRAQLVTERAAVFAPTPEAEAARPRSASEIPNLLLAGDWTASGWPSTMEGAVRSGYLAAEAALAHFGEQHSLLAPDLPWQGLSRWICRR